MENHEILKVTDQKYGITELRKNLGGIIKANVKDNQTVTVMNNKTDIAVIVPIQKYKQLINK